MDIENKKYIISDNEIFLVSTDTVTGIGGKVNEIVKNKLYNLKKRDLTKKIIIILGSKKQLKKFEKISSLHKKYIKKYWPGNVSLVINEQCYRIPKCKKLIKFIKKQGPFYLTSANISGEQPSNNKEEVKRIFPNLKFFDFCKGDGKPSIILDTNSGKRLR